ncbi:helix-turn-helix domain-containing protein [Dysgonomonas sp. 511]|uniref:helix-turn-helix domain-containing protein n=1 Tax=Dysgonomonas sp. 511 TaxID=2302930 RepID=UPI0013D1BCCE|nr:helix-turn-helix domain-containing protein [Dysgonomonas sp. 511]NDV77862.1 hypothetical protein [Dysgonomonas sp. 511]
MENAVNNRIRRIIKAENITQEIFCTIIGIPLSTLKTSFQRDSNPNFELMHGVAENFPAYSMDWLITGKGEMYKTEYNAGRDNNVNAGDNNKNYAINDNPNLGMVGENSGSYNYVSMGDRKVKKLLKEGEISIEMEQSAEIELLKQTNGFLEARIRDLEKQIESKDKTYEEMKASKDQTIETYKLMIENFIMTKK